MIGRIGAGCAQPARPIAQHCARRRRIGRGGERQHEHVSVPEHMPAVDVAGRCRGRRRRPRRSRRSARSDGTSPGAGRAAARDPRRARCHSSPIAVLHASRCSASSASKPCRSASSSRSRARLGVGHSQRVKGVGSDAIEHAVLAPLARRHGRAARSAAHENDPRRAVALLVHEEDGLGRRADRQSETLPDLEPASPAPGRAAPRPAAACRRSRRRGQRPCPGAPASRT